jgi:hypothetical protein
LSASAVAELDVELEGAGALGVALEDELEEVDWSFF